MMRRRVQRNILQMRINILRHILLLESTRERSVGVREIFRRRATQGDGHNLVQEMRLQDEEMFFNYTRMSREMFENLLAMVGPRLKKREMYTRLTEIQRLSITLRFLAAGDSQATLSFAYRCGQSTISVILKETLPAIADALEAAFLKPPRSVDEWCHIRHGFLERWNLPNCLGAIDGKHIVIQAPQASGSSFFNYKKSFSIVLLAVCDANYLFRIIDLGAEGSLSDGAILRNSMFGQNLEEGKLFLPPPSTLPNSEILFNNYFVGDNAFPLREYLMKPYASRTLSHKEAIFNYRISRARRVVENAFGILAARWRILRKPFCSTMETSKNIVKAAVTLHNFIKKTDEENNLCNYCPPAFIDQELPNGTLIEGEWRSIISDDEVGVRTCPRMGARNYTNVVGQKRDILMEYLNGPGAVAWQEQHVRTGYWGAVAQL